MGLDSAIAHLLKARRISAPSQSYAKDNPGEWAKVKAYLEGGARPTGVVTEMGLGLIEVEDARRGTPDPDPEPEPGTEWFPASWLSGPSGDDFFRKAMPPRKGVFVGIWDSGHPGISRITQREGEVGRRFDIAGGSYYGQMPNSDGKITLIKQGGRLPLADAGHYGISGVNEILSGSKDTFIRQWVKAAAAAGGSDPILVRQFHEYAGPWMAAHWIDAGHSRRCTSAEWQQMCRRPVDIARQEGITNIIWIWCATIYDDRAAIYASYPGDDYVDLIGDDNYGYADQQWMGYEFGWATHAMVHNYPVVQYPAGDPRREELKMMAEFRPSKPYMVCETGRAPHSNDSGQKKAWLQEMPAQAKTYLPRLVMHLYSDYGHEADPGGDWTLDHPASALDGYRSAVNDPYWNTRDL